MFTFTIFSSFLAAVLAADLLSSVNSLPASFFGQSHYQIHENADIDSVPLETVYPIHHSFPTSSQYHHQVFRGVTLQSQPEFFHSVHQPISTSNQFHHQTHNSNNIETKSVVPVVGHSVQTLRAALPSHQSVLTSGLKVTPADELHAVKTVWQPLATSSQSRSQIHNNAFQLPPQYSEVQIVPEYAGILPPYIPGHLHVPHYYPTLSQIYEDPHTQQIQSGENQESEAAVSGIHGDHSQHLNDLKSDDEVNDSVSVDSA